MAFVEAMAIEVSRATVPDRPILQAPFPVSPTTRRIERFGSDKPDVRFGMELVDLGPALVGAGRHAGVRVPACSTTALAAGGRVKAIVAPGMAGDHPARDRRADRARPAVRREGPGLPRARGRTARSRARSPSSCPTTRSARSSSRPAAAEGDLILIVADTHEVDRRRARPAARGARRPARAGRPERPGLRLGPPLPDVPVGHRERPLGRHPQPVQRRPARGRGAARDGLRRPGRAVARRTRPAAPGRSSTTSRSTAGSSAAARSGSIAATCSSARFLLQGQTLEGMREKFGAVLDAFEYGAPPHGGIALGIDRWAALLARQTNIREVMAFPKTQSGTDPMLEAPSMPEPGQYEELGLRFVGAANRAGRGPERRPTPRRRSAILGRSTGSRSGRASRRCSARRASRSRGSSTCSRRCRPRPGRSTGPSSGCRCSCSSRSASGGATARCRAQDDPAGGHRRRLLHRRPDVLAPRDRGGRGGAGDRPRQPAGDHRRLRRVAAPRGAAVAGDAARPAGRAGRRRADLGRRSATDAYGADPQLGVVLGIATAICYAGYLLIIRGAGATRAGRPARWRSRRSSSRSCAVRGRRGRRRPRPDAAARRACSGWRCSGSPSQSVGYLLISISLPRLPAIITSIILLAQPVMSIGAGHRPARRDAVIGAAARRRARHRRDRGRDDPGRRGSGTGSERVRAGRPPTRVTVTAAAQGSGQSRPRRRRRRPTRGCGRRADRAGPRRPAGRAESVSTSWTTPGSPTSIEPAGHGGGEVVDDVGRHPVRGHGAQRVQVARSAAGPASPARRARPVAASCRGAVPCASMSEVIVSGPTQVIRAGQSRTAVVSRTSASASSAPRTIWPTGPALGRGRGAVDRLGADQRRRDGAVGIGRHDDDRQRAARPGEVGEPPDARLAERVGEGALGGGGQDDGGDGHAPECSGPSTRSSRVPASVGQSAVPFDWSSYPPVPDAPTETRHQRPDRRPRRPAQRRHRRPRRPRQDHARRRDAPPDRRLPLEPGRRRPGHGLGRPRAREGDHDPRQADDRRPRRRPPQHRRHARPRRLRRRGRALAADGRFGAAPRRRRRGAAAADPLRPPEGDGAPPAGRRRDQQDRPRRRPPGRGPRRRLRAVHGPRRRRPPDRVPDRLHERQGRHRDAATSTSPGTDLRPLLDLLVEVTPPVDLHARPPAPAAGHEPVGQRLRRPDGRRADLERDDPDGPADHGRPRGGRRHGGLRRAGPDGHAHRHRDQPPDRARHRPRRHRGGRARATSSASPACPR